MKKLIIKSLIVVFLSLVVIAIPAVLIDPYNVFHPLAIRDNGVEPNKNYTKMVYILSNKGKFDSLMFGSSRVGAIHTSNIEKENCYNMTYSAGVPREHFDNIKTLIENDVPIKKIYIGVDSISYTFDYDDHLSEPIRMPYELSIDDPVSFWTAYLDPAIVEQSIKRIVTYHMRNSELSNEAKYYYIDGNNCKYNRKTSYDFSTATPLIGESYLLNESLSDMQRIKDFCEENEIELVVFTNPMYCVTYTASLENDYLLFLKGLSKITPFYNFSSYNDVTINSDNYIDTSHYKAEIGDMIIDVICNDTIDAGLQSQGFGRYITEDNVDDTIAFLKKQWSDQFCK